MMTTSEMEVGELVFPRVAVCPGFKPGAFSQKDFPEFHAQGRGMETYFDTYEAGEGLA